MDFDQLQTLLEVARHASFSRAAEKRFRTQPAISSQIRSLEEEGGAKLFDRSGGKVSLTAGGEAFQKDFRDVSVNIKRADYSGIRESVIDNSVDFGVVSLPVTDNRLTVVLIHRDELVIIVPPSHPLGKMKSAPVAEAAKFPLVVPKVGHTRDSLEELFHERRLKPNYTSALDSSELLKRFVAGG